MLPRSAKRLAACCRSLNACDFIESANQIREQVKALLQETADYEIGFQEKTPLAKTVCTCRQLLKVEPAMWLFVTVEGVEPTNNAAERAIRPAVLWPRPVLALRVKQEVTLWRGC